MFDSSHTGAAHAGLTAAAAPPSHACFADQRASCALVHATKLMSCTGKQAAKRMAD